MHYSVTVKPTYPNDIKRSIKRQSRPHIQQSRPRTPKTALATTIRRTSKQFDSISYITQPVRKPKVTKIKRYIFIKFLHRSIDRVKASHYIINARVLRVCIQMRLRLALPGARSSQAQTNIAHHVFQLFVHIRYTQQGIQTKSEPQIPENEVCRRIRRLQIQKPKIQSLLL